MVVDGGDLARRIGGALWAPFQRIGWALQRWLIWPVADRLPRPEGGPRVVLVGVLVVAAGVAGAAGLLIVASSGSGGSAQTEAAAPAVRVVQAAPPADQPPAAPTLHGAAPDFKPPSKEQQKATSAAEQAEAIPLEADEPASSSSSGSAATGRISSAPSAQVSTATGPAPIAVAREFADAFVVYETGGEAATVRDAFGKTATHELARALLQRPPRLPADVKVPRAKVVNVVAGPSHGPIHSYSVSLLRVGVTSELRLAMQKMKDDGWRVSDVLG